MGKFGYANLEYPFISSLFSILFPGGNAAEPVIAQELVRRIQGTGLDHLIDRGALGGAMQGIRTTRLFAGHAILNAGQRIGRVGDGVITGRGIQYGSVEATTPSFAMWGMSA